MFYLKEQSPAPCGQVGKNSVQNPTVCTQLDLTKWEQGYEKLPCDVVDTPDSVVYLAANSLALKSRSVSCRILSYAIQLKA
jgi:hypothetical protein